jgi:hypothetical protein
VARHTQVSQALQQQIAVHQIVSLSEVHKAGEQLATAATRDTCSVNQVLQSKNMITSAVAIPETRLTPDWASIGLTPLRQTPV